MQFVGMDIGSSSIKGAVLDVDSLSVGPVRQVPFVDPFPGLPSGHFEVDPLRIVDRVEGVLRELLRQTPDCEGVLVCGQMGGVVLATSAGHPLSNYLSWRDQRVLTQHPNQSTSYLDTASRRLGKDVLRQLGQELRAGSATSLLYWLAEQGRLPSEPAVPLSLSDFVLLRLCGGEPTCNLTQALGTLHLSALDWHREAFASLGIDRLAWPELCDYRRPVGFLREGTRRLPCYSPVGDHQCALAGALLDSRELSLNISTGSQVSLLTSQLQLGDYQSRPYFDRVWLNTITHLTAGRSLSVLVDLLCEIGNSDGRPPSDPWSYISAAAAAQPDTDLEVDLAFFAGPMGDRGRIGNIRLENLTVGHLFCAAFRHMAANYKSGAARLSPDRAWDSLTLSGGLAQKLPALRERIAEQFVCPQRVCSTTEETLTGLLLLGSVISGRHSNLSAATAYAHSHLS